MSFWDEPIVTLRTVRGQRDLAFCEANHVKMLDHLPKLVFIQVRLHIVHDSRLDDHHAVILRVRCVIMRGIQRMRV